MTPPWHSTCCRMPSASMFARCWRRGASGKGGGHRAAGGVPVAWISSGDDRGARSGLGSNRAVSDPLRVLAVDLGATSVRAAVDLSVEEPAVEVLHRWEHPDQSGRWVVALGLATNRLRGGDGTGTGPGHRGRRLDWGRRLGCRLRLDRSERDSGRPPVLLPGLEDGPVAGDCRPNRARTSL